jgi:tetratricopeptide (TPR) repeat protein
MPPAIAETLPANSSNTLQDLQQKWAEANYEMQGDAQVERFESLVAEAEAAAAAHPTDPEILIWEGIIKSTSAGKAGGLSALSLVKGARTALEQAMKIDDMALNGSAYTSLGALYYQVPGWPIAFGSDKKARELLEKAIQVNPNGIDSNFFYGDFLLQQKDYAAARLAFEKALAAPDRPGRVLADTGRRLEIRERLERLDS